MLFYEVVVGQLSWPIEGAEGQIQELDRLGCPWLPELVYCGTDQGASVHHVQTDQEVGVGVGVGPLYLS